MVYLFAGFAIREERVCLPITTGCAAHTSYGDAVLSGILEVVERDAISMVWLQRLSLPRIQIDELPPSLAPYWDRYQRSSRGLEYIFFDATTDVGLSTVYGLQVSGSNRRLTTLVSCSAALNPSQAVIKVMRDMVATRIAFQAPRPTPDRYEDFTGVFHGASYMARGENASAFDFLLHSGRTRSLSEMEGHEGSAGRQGLSAVLEVLRRKRLEAFVADLSTDEALRSNMLVVRVIVPGLQPLSFHYRARYLGHPRLYEAPRQMGYPVHSEQNLNPWPQPFC
jgi:ribosomal protein S12 methylthiotransferase accessory factor